MNIEHRGHFRSVYTFLYHQILLVEAVKSSEAIGDITEWEDAARTAVIRAYCRRYVINYCRHAGVGTENGRLRWNDVVVEALPVVLINSVCSAGLDRAHVINRSVRREEMLRAAAHLPDDFQTCAMSGSSGVSPGWGGRSSGAVLITLVW